MGSREERRAGKKERKLPRRKRYKGGRKVKSASIGIINRMHGVKEWEIGVALLGLTLVLQTACNTA